MRKLALIGLAVVVVGVAVVFLLRPAPKPTPGTVAANGVTLKSASITLPADDALFPGPHADAINANCTACHSTSMVLTQPHLTPEQWAGEVKKMRETYKASIAESDVPAILAYLNAMPGQRSAPERAQPLN